MSAGEEYFGHPFAISIEYISRSNGKGGRARSNLSREGRGKVRSGAKAKQKTRPGTEVDLKIEAQF